MSYKTPGVYVEEIVKFPPSVAQVETAIPAFIGYTEKAKKKEDDDLDMTPLRITSMLEYETYFGYADKETGIGVKITDTIVDEVKSRDILVTAPLEPSPYKMYYSMQMYFANGGGPCYIISVGDYSAPVALGDLQEGLSELEKKDEPTLIVFPDATSLGGESDFYSLYKSALTQCNKLQDRFTIVDTFTSEDIDTDSSALRSQIGNEKDYLKYGAAYYPHLDTSLNFRIDHDNISITHINTEQPGAADVITTNVQGIDFNTQIDAIIYDNSVDYEGSLAEVYNFMYDDLDLGNTPDYSSPKPLEFLEKLNTLLTDISEIIRLKAKANDEANAAIIALKEESPTDANEISTALGVFNTTFTHGVDNDIEIIYETLKKLSENLKKGIDDASSLRIGNQIKSNNTNILAEIEKLLTNNSATITTPVASAGNSTMFDGIESAWQDLKASIINDGGSNTNIGLDKNNGALHGRDLAFIEDIENATYHKILSEINALPVTLPPSSTIAGIYARVDSTRGVWKAPANVGVTYVSEPSVYISHEAQQNLNVDVDGGKSINAIRTFVGKGNLVWGARTLAGNDNEWRYVPVRRFFNMAEESIKKATEQFVFEPNDKNTWVSVKGMISNFLNQQWRAGALAGTTPEQAFYVSIGLGETMTAQDILEGSMIVEIGMAVVRPAEFIVLKFSHKMQEV